MAENATCPLCEGIWPENKTPKDHGSVIYFKCARCGSFGAAPSIFQSLSSLPLQVRRALVRIRSEMHLAPFDDTPLITSEMIESARRVKIRITEMADKLLTYCVKNSTSLGQLFPFYEVNLLKSCDALNVGELSTLVEFLSDLGTADGGEDAFFRITPSGYRQVEEGMISTGDSKQAFVAMWFDNELNEVFESGFAKAIEQSGYIPFRIDRKEHNQKIDDEIIAEIRKSKFLVADFTGHRGGVYFEAGFAMGLGLPIIWTCRRSDVSQLHFDIRQYNCIDWLTQDDLAGRLSNRIVALLGRGN